MKGVYEIQIETVSGALKYLLTILHLNPLEILDIKRKVTFFTYFANETWGTQAYEFARDVRWITGPSVLARIGTAGKLEGKKGITSIIPSLNMETGRVTTK